jgi:hypothetical protein
MKKITFVSILAAAMIALPGCSVVSGIFKAGMWWAFFLVFIVIALIVWIATKAKK